VNVEPDAPKEHALQGVDREFVTRNGTYASPIGMNRWSEREHRARAATSLALKSEAMSPPDVGIGLAEPVGAEVVAELLEELPVHVPVAAGRVLDDATAGVAAMKSSKTAATLSHVQTWPRDRGSAAVIRRGTLR